MELFTALPIIQSPTTGFCQIIDNNIVIKISFTLCYAGNQPSLLYLRGQHMMDIKSSV